MATVATRECEQLRCNDLGFLARGVLQYFTYGAQEQCDSDGEFDRQQRRSCSDSSWAFSETSCATGSCADSVASTAAGAWDSEDEAESLSAVDFSGAVSLKQLHEANLRKRRLDIVATLSPPDLHAWQQDRLAASQTPEPDAESSSDAYRVIWSGMKRRQKRGMAAGCSRTNVLTEQQ